MGAVNIGPADLESAKNFLQGKRTYLAALIAVLYLIGVWAGLWAFDEKVLALLGFGGLAALRSAMNQLPRRDAEGCDRAGRAPPSTP